MTIVRYDPFRDLRTLQEEVNRLFSTNLTRGFGEEGIGRGAWNPSVDIYENKDHIVLEAELPGMKREDFELSVENNVITLRGERQFEKKDDSDNYHRVERSYGSFTRSFTDKFERIQSGWAIFAKILRKRTRIALINSTSAFEKCETRRSFSSSNVLWNCHA